MTCRRFLNTSLFALALLLIDISGVSAEAKSNQIRYEYVAPKISEHQAIHDQMKQGHTLEHLQELLSPLRLPHPLMLKVASCDGDTNAWYSQETITVCYELLLEFEKNTSSNDLPPGLLRADAIIGPALDVFLHETGHAVFDMLQIPVLGRQEDAADQFSAYLMMQLSSDEARRMILGAAYQYKIQMPGPQVTVQIDSFSGDHSVPAQRAFNNLCIAYGKDRKLFSDIVEKGLLPKDRAEVCERDYEDLNFAMTKLIGPFIDKQLAKNFHEVWTRTIGERRARFTRP